MELKNNKLGLIIDETTGSIARVENLESGVVLVDATGARSQYGRLFRVILPVKTWTSRYADSHTSTPPHITKEGNFVKIVFDDLLVQGQRTGVQAVVTVELPPDTSQACFSLRLSNNGAGDVTDVLFPWVGGWIDQRNDAITFGGRKVVRSREFPLSKPQLHGGACHRSEARFPVEIYVPWIDVSGPTGGLSYINYMKQATIGAGVVHNLGMYNYPQDIQLSFGWNHFPLIEPGKSWTSNMIAISPHSGDWHTTANTYRQWVDSWHKKEAPANRRLRESIGFQQIFLRWFDGTPLNEIESIPDLARAGLKYGVEYLNVWDYLMGGEYARHEDRELFDYSADEARQIREGIQEARKAGCTVAGILNVFSANPTTSLYRREGHKQLLQRYDGTLYGYSWAGARNHPMFWCLHQGPESYEYDPRNEAYRKRVLSYVEQCAALGFQGFYHDQPFNHDPGYNRRAEGDPPDNVHQARIDLIRQMRQKMAANDPNAFLIGEFTDPWISQVIDISLAWYGSSQVSFEELERIAYSMPQVIHAYPVDQRIDHANHAFALGMQFWLCPHMSERTLEDVPDFAEHVAKLGRLRRQTAERVSRGRFNHTLGFVAQLDEKIVAYSYDSPAGPAIVAASLGQAGRVSLRVDRNAFCNAGTAHGQLFKLTDSIKETGKTSNLNFDLEANEVAIWCL